MKNINQIVKKYLEEQPLARERKNKDRAIVNLLLRKFSSLTVLGVTKETLTAFVQGYASYDRAWRQVLEHHENLRGSDYGKKEILVQEKQIELGYGDQRKLKFI